MTAVLRIVALLMVALVVAGCGHDAVTLRSPDVDVDTPALRSLKEQARVDDCPRAIATADGGLPDVTLPCLGGGRDVELAALRGPLVINLWAQWCDPCRKELRFYQAFHEKYAGRVEVLGVDWNDYQPEAALRLAAQEGVTYPLVVDLEPHIRAVGNLLPQVLLVDADGRVVHQEAVQIKSERQLERLVRDHLPVGG